MIMTVMMIGQFKMMMMTMMMIMMMIGQYKTTQADTDPLVCAGRDINVHDRGLTLINKFGQIIEISRNHNWKSPDSYLYHVSACIMYHDCVGTVMSVLEYLNGQGLLK